MTVAPVGTHCVLELYGCSSDILDDESFIRGAVEEASRQGMSTLLQLTSHKFHPQGVTAIGLLAESHISIHTWPEHGYAAADIFTCGETATPLMACEFLARQLQASRHKVQVLDRGLRHLGTWSDGRREEDLCPVRT